MFETKAFKLAVSTFGLATALWSLAVAPSFAAESAETCTADGYMLVMGGIEDESTVPDMDRAMSYGPAVWDLVESYDAFYLIRHAPDEIYEGDWPAWKLGVISKWPCRETGIEFWNSDAYQNDVKPLRKDAGYYDVGMFNPGPTFPPAENLDLVPASCASPYLVAILSKVTDTDAYGQYTAALQESGLARRAGFQYLLGGQPLEVLEGDWPSDYNTMISVYPCKAAWEGFYKNAFYESDIKPLRKGAGDFIIVGFEPERIN